MSVYATNMFSTQPGRARDLIDTLTRVLPDTLKHGGCELIQILHVRRRALDRIEAMSVHRDREALTTSVRWVRPEW
jgi:Antibiotic biosynthesis monooxygenase